MARGRTPPFVSLLASCAMNGIEPWPYLRDLFCLLPSWPVNRVIEPAPANWATLLQKPGVREQLDANIFRRATLLPATSNPQQPTA